MKNKIIFISTLFIFLSFIGIKNTQASGQTINISTDTGVVYLTANLNKSLYTPEEEIRADITLNLGSAAHTVASASGSANAGSASFDNLINNITRSARIGTAQPTPGTYNASFSYSYDQTNLYYTLLASEDGTGMPNYVRCNIGVYTDSDTYQKSIGRGLSPIVANVTIIPMNSWGGTGLTETITFPPSFNFNDPYIITPDEFGCAPGGSYGLRVNWYEPIGQNDVNIFVGGDY